MTVFQNREVLCGNCGASSFHCVMFSSSSFGSGDLDLRPAPLHRHTIDSWVQECPTCLAVCPDISAPPDKIAEIIKAPEYQHIVTGRSIPDLCRKFRAWAYIAGRAGRAEDAAFAHLHVAWAADDESDAEVARAERLAAIPLFQALRDAAKLYAEQPGAAEILLADLWRRSQQWDNASTEAKLGHGKAQDPLIRSICEFQLSLAQRHDDLVHTFDEVQPAT